MNYRDMSKILLNVYVAAALAEEHSIIMLNVLAGLMLLLAIIADKKGV